MRAARAVLPALLALLSIPPAAAAQSMPPVGIVDVYGLRTIPDTIVRRAIGIAPGAAVPDSLAAAAALARLRAIPGVDSAAIEVVCCEEGQSILYVGIAVRGGPVLRLAPAPGGSVRLPAEVVAAGARYDSAFAAAIEAGDFEEDRSAGHSLLHFPPARRAQEALIPLASRYAARLRDVLRRSSDPAQRARAAEVLAYHPDKRSVVPALVAAVRDPDPGVRNDVIRALAVIAVLDAARPDLRIGVPAEPFIDLVNSPVWTDRNKGVMALAAVTERRDTALLARLRRAALPALIEMARWKSLGHASGALLVLGRIGGMSEDEIAAAAFQRGDREAIIRAARDHAAAGG